MKPPQRELEPAAPATQVADVVAPVAVDTAYSYRAPAGLGLAVGDLVDIPLGTRETTGVVWRLRDTPGSNLKTVSAKRDLPPLRPELLRFVDWVARWTLSPRGMVLRMAIRAAEEFGPGHRRLQIGRHGRFGGWRGLFRRRVPRGCEPQQRDRQQQARQAGHGGDVLIGARLIAP